MICTMNDVWKVQRFAALVATSRLSSGDIHASSDAPDAESTDHPTDRREGLSVCRRCARPVCGCPDPAYAGVVATNDNAVVLYTVRQGHIAVEIAGIGPSEDAAGEEFAISERDAADRYSEQLSAFVGLPIRHLALAGTQNAD